MRSDPGLARKSNWILMFGLGIPTQRRRYGTRGLRYVVATPQILYLGLDEEYRYF